MQPDFAAIDELFAAACDGRATPDETARLSALLRESAELRDLYLMYMDAHAQLASDPRLFSGNSGGLAAPDRPSSSKLPVRSAVSARWRRFAAAIHPRRHPLTFAATVALLTLCYWIGMHAAFLRPKPQAPPSHSAAALLDVAAVSGLHEVAWASEQTPHYEGERIFAGSALQFREGLLELTFDTGVRIVVEGPAELQVESVSSTRLVEGKLVALVPPEGRGFTLDVVSARIVDLGTEFGVVSQRSGAADLAVFQGAVKVSPPAGGQVRWKSQRLVAGQSLRLEQSGPRSAGTNKAGLMLVRALPSSDLSLDVADIVAGGSGRGGGVNRGIRLHSGAPTARFEEGIVSPGGACHPVAESAFIHGVFIIRGDEGPQPLTVSGDKSFTFPAGTGSSWGPIWAWEPTTGNPSSHTWIYAYPINPGRLIAMHANAGMTIDLAELRAMYPDHHVRRLLGYVLDEFVPDRLGRGNRTAAWVIVDGQARVANLPLRSGEKPARIDVTLADDDRYLTLATTDGGDGLTCDFVMWKHLRFLLEPASGDRAVTENVAPKSNDQGAGMD